MSEHYPSKHPLHYRIIKMSFIPPTITTANGNTVKNNDKISGSSITFKGNAFPGILNIDVDNSYAPAKQTVIASSTGEWEVTLSPVNPGITKITVTELDATPKSVSLTFEVLSAIVETLDNEDLRCSNYIHFITKKGVMFRHNGTAARNIMRASEALHNLPSGAPIADAERFSKFGENVYSCMSTGEGAWLTSIFLIGKDSSLIKFSKVSFSYFSAKPVQLDFTDGAKIISSSASAAGINQLVFNGSVINEVRIRGTAAGDYLVVGHLEFTPI